MPKFIGGIYLFSHWSSLVAQLVKNPPVQFWFKRPRFNSWVGKIPWRSERLPTPIFLPGEFHGQRSLAGYSHGITKSDMTEQLSLHLIHLFPIASFLYLLEGFICFPYSPSFLKQTLMSYTNEKRQGKK